MWLKLLLFNCWGDTADCEWHTAIGYAEKKKKVGVDQIESRLEQMEPGGARGAADRNQGSIPTAPSG